MEIGSIDRTEGNVLSNVVLDPEQAQNGRAAFTVMRQLSALDLGDREFTVVRDPDSHRFVVHVVDRSTGAVLDQFPPETILKMLSQLQSFKTSQEGQVQA